MGGHEYPRDDKGTKDIVLYRESQIGLFGTWWRAHMMAATIVIFPKKHKMDSYPEI